MKALILAGGRGSRLTDITKLQNKSLIKIGGKCLIEHNLDKVATIAEISEIVIVVGYRAEDIINRFGTEYKGKKIRYVIQKEQHGLVHAIECAKEAIGSDDFLLMLADELLINEKVKDMVQKFCSENLFGICGVINESDKQKISKTYTVMVNENGRIFRLIEKPPVAINNLQGTGHCILKNQILDYMARTPINPNRGEKELVDLIQCAVDEGHTILVFVVADKYSNINTEEDIEYIEKFL